MIILYKKSNHYSFCINIFPEINLLISLNQIAIAIHSIMYFFLSPVKEKNKFIQFSCTFFKVPDLTQYIGKNVTLVF